MNEFTKTALSMQISAIVRATISRSRASDEGSRNPFRSALIDDRHWAIPKFERSFVTSMGSRGYEELARLIAEGAGHTATRNRITQGPITDSQSLHIEQVLRGLRTNTRAPDWDQEVSDLALLSLEGNRTTVSVTSDLYVETSAGAELFFSMKTVKPNLDQTERAKRDMLELIAMDSTHKPYFALPYNPFGDARDTYNWQPAFRIFDMRNDPVVLIGKDFWDLLGGEGTYEELLRIFARVGEELKTEIEAHFGHP